MAEVQGAAVALGSIATIEIGVEVKILAKAMLKQIDRVAGDMRHQVDHFERGGDRPITLGVVGINQADGYTSFEGERSYTTTGRSSAPHPSQEAAEAERRLMRDARPNYDEFLVLRFRATNAEPYAFEWVDYPGTDLDYAAILTRISREYDARFADRH